MPFARQEAHLPDLPPYGYARPDLGAILRVLNLMLMGELGTAQPSVQVHSFAELGWMREKCLKDTALVH